MYSCMKHFCSDKIEEAEKDIKAGVDNKKSG